MNTVELSYQVIRTFKKLNKNMMKKIRCEFKEFGLTGTQAMLIGNLAHNGELTVGEISKKMGLSISTVSGIIDRLEENKMIERKRSEKDRRVVKVSLSLKAKQIAAPKHEMIGNHMEQLIKSASEDELLTIMKGFETLEEVMNRNEEKENK